MTGLSQKESGRVLNAIFGGKLDGNTNLGIIADALSGKEQVSLPGFGRFYAQHRAARTGLNPQTKEAIQIPARNVPKFSAGKSLKDAAQ
jgi:nucleoid DNA-binding protein